MTAAEASRKILDTMLGHLGFPATIEIEEKEGGLNAQILTSESRYLIGKDGGRLDDLQYMANRILRRHFERPPRLRVDCEHYRDMQEDELIQEVRGMAERVKASGQPLRLRPLNAYYRRLVHNAMLDDPEVATVSPQGDERLKRITLKLKNAKE